MCATHNVSHSTQTIMTQAFKEGGEMCKLISEGKAQWVDLFSKGNFFVRYKFYLMITASSNSADTQLKWEGTVESKLRQLVMRLETVPEVDIAHPYVKGFEKAYKTVNDEERDQIARGIVSPAVEERSKETPPVTDGKTPEEDTEATKKQDEAEGTQTIWTTNFFIGLAIRPKDRVYCPLPVLLRDFAHSATAC